MKKLFKLVLSLGIFITLTQCKPLQVTCEIVDIETCLSGFRHKVVGENINSYVCLDSGEQCQMPYEATY